MTLDRRKFLTRGLLATAAVAAGGEGTRRLRGAAPADSAADTDALALGPNGRLVAVASATPAAPPRDIRKGVSGRKWVMVIDLALCDGCGSCVDACNESHFMPRDRQWLRLYRMRDSHDTAPYWFPKPCFHCDDPPCTRVCPVGATFKRQDGLVLVDNERCIGCRFCMAACPYSTRVFNWGRPVNPPGVQAPESGIPRRIGTVEKCDFCAPELALGKLPHCVTACDMGAVYCGDQNEDAVTNSRGETLRLSQLLRDRAGYRYLEELGTEPRVFYLPPRGRRYPAPGEEAAAGVAAAAEAGGT